MTATEELRRLLDERGVEHYDGTESTLWLKDEHGYRASADERSSGRLSIHIWCDTPEHAIAATLDAGTLQAENAKLREQMEQLVTLLRVNCDIEASWDDLCRFWNIGLTENGCLMRDRACKAEAENAKLRELVTRIWRTARLMDANEHIDGMRITDEFRASCEVAFAELGVEV